MSRSVLSNVLGLVGAVAGGAVGFFAFRWLLSQSLYAIVLPTALVGVGGGLLARHESVIRGVACAVVGLLLGLFTEWYNLPFVVDESLGYFARHVGDLPTGHLVFMAVGALASFWFGKGTYRDARVGRPKPQATAERDLG